MEVGIRELKDNLSSFIRRVEAGERILVTTHGRVVAEIVAPIAPRTSPISRFDRMIASGVIRPPVADGDPFEGLPEINLPAGTAAALINLDRDEA